MHRRALLALTLLLAALAPAGRAIAAPTMEIGMADDRLLFSDGGAAAVRDWASAGVDVVRIHARWDAVSPQPDATVPPEGFLPENANDPQYRWGVLDRAVGLVRGAGMRAVLSVTGPGPVWASQIPGHHNRRWKPDPRFFGAFARAVAQRYGGQVDRYLIWNEPNVPLWLEPQRSCDRRHHCTAYAADLYRELVLAATPAIQAADPGAQVVIATLAPIGSDRPATNSPLRPLAFLREMACVDRRLHALRSGACRGFTPVPADGISLHPHGVKTPPDGHDPSRDDAKLGDLRRAERLVDSLVARGRIAASTTPLPFYLTEFGYQTDPPDPYVGVPPLTQAAWLTRADEIAWLDPRVANLTQYVWRDEPVYRSSHGKDYSGWQSGVFYADGTAKPSLTAFRFPFLVKRGRGRSATIWGQVRPGGAHAVTVYVDGRVLTTATTDDQGAFGARVTLPAGSRAVYARADDGAAESLPVTVRV